MLVEGADWTLVVAAAKNDVIGRANELPWKLRSDLKRFKAVTMGHCLLMGRKTFASIGRPLPGRQTIVLSRSGYQCEFQEVSVVSSLGQAAECIQAGRRMMVVGGAEVYRLALPQCSEILITRVQSEVAGDTYLPKIDWERWRLISREICEAGPRDEFETEFQRWQRI